MCSHCLSPPVLQPRDSSSPTSTCFVLNSRPSTFGCPDHHPGTGPSAPAIDSASAATAISASVAPPTRVNMASRLPRSQQIEGGGGRRRGAKRGAILGSQHARIDGVIEERRERRPEAIHVEEDD